MSKSKVVGALLLVVTVVISIAHLYYGYYVGSWGTSALAFALPITAGVLAICALGFWLGWIMVTTKEPAPAPAPSVSEESEEAEEE
ncbi:MAG: hypothetical protein KGY45_03845 [Hadesarchaea archaeon]|nr:hypothetical protein [Hadesarchaea archaeon]